MASDKTPDDATGDGVKSAELLDRVRVFFAALLAFLGFRAMPTDTVSTMLETLTAWLKDAKAIRRDPQGATAKIWWDAFKFAWGLRHADSACVAVQASAEDDANDAVARFGRYFLPVADEEDRDTLNTADFDAMRDELDQADRYRQEICDAIDGRYIGQRKFVHPQMIDELRAERDVLLKTNAHHAGELAECRIECERLRQAVFDAGGIVQSIGAERDELKRALAGAIVPQTKPERVEVGQKWAHVDVVYEIDGNWVFTTNGGEYNTENLHNSEWLVYLGTDGA